MQNLKPILSANKILRNTLPRFSRSPVWVCLYEKEHSLFMCKYKEVIVFAGFLR